MPLTLAQRIDRLDVRGPGGYLQLARAEHNGWRLYQPFAARADAATVAALVEKLLACSVVQFVQDGVGDLAPYGLDSQSAVSAVLVTRQAVQLQLKNGQIIGKDDLV